MIEIEKFVSGHYEQAFEYKYFVPNRIDDLSTLLQRYEPLV